MEINLGIQGNGSAESREKEVVTPTGGERGKAPGRKDEAASPGDQATDTWGPGCGGGHGLWPTWDLTQRLWGIRAQKGPQEGPTE